MIRKGEIFFEYRMYDILTHYCSNDETIEMEPSHLGLESHGMKMRPDLYLPNGCKALHLKEKTIIELHSVFDFEVLQLLRIIHDNFYSVMREKGYNFLCVLMHSEKSPSYIKVTDYPLHGRNSEDFQIMTLNDLLGSANKKSPPIEIKEQNKNNLVIKKAATSIMSEQCSFILGAGVSMDAKLPSWEVLLKRLINKAHVDMDLLLDARDYDNLFKDCGSSSIILGRLVYTLFHDDEKRFKHAIQQALYQGREYQPGALADAVCNLIKYKYDNKSLTSIITYNYDDLIERGLKNKNLLNIPVFGNQKQNLYIPVYHVHGYLPQGDEKESILVLSEKEYHDIYKTAYHWSNVEQLHAMQRSVCFFVGLSMTDPNLRRLLDIANGGQIDSDYQDIRHYAFLRKADVSKDLEGQKAAEFRKKMEDMLKGLGVAVIWYDEHAELPSILNQLRNNNS